MINEQQSGKENKALPVAKRNQDRRDSAGESGGNAGAGRSGHEDLGSEKPQDDLGSNKPGKGAGGEKPVDDDPNR